MNINTLDLNLFLVFRAIYATRSVTLAGERLCMTQSAVSNALRRLRDRFNDPLFVRTPAGMVPTAMAAQLMPLVEEGLCNFTEAIERARTFDPASSDRLFRLAINDVGQWVTVPHILRMLHTQAPALRVETVSASSAQEARQLALNGEIDFALGTWSPMGPGFYHDKLFDDSFAVLMSERHPASGSPLTLTGYLDAGHVVYRPSGTSDIALRDALAHEDILDRRKVVLIVAHSLGLATIIARTNLIVTLPRRLADAMNASQPHLRVECLPFSIAPFPVWLHWHERNHADEGHSWLRQQIFATLARMPEAA